MSQHRKRTEKQARGLIAGAAVVTVAVGVGLGLWAGGDSDPAGSARSQAESPLGGRDEASRAPSRAPSPTPTRSYPLSTTPRTIPAVRAHTPERGPGWRPAPGRRVVVNDAGLADEGRLLAGELGLTYAGQKNDVRAGDVRLAVDGGKRADPESYRMTVRGGRVAISGPDDAGVFYGTRTLKQAVHGGGTAPEGVVRDEPAKPVRGFSLDIARKNF
ncbi:MAG: glycoside hydrolase family 20 zincin-like fold domain-containing protein, partial [Streptomyces sp.]|nr:glycoside hydrolase family 20 zincin-like fold domain-containing protein [Streptomyces sp.]